MDLWLVSPLCVFSAAIELPFHRLWPDGHGSKADRHPILSWPKRELQLLAARFRGGGAKNRRGFGKHAAVFRRLFLYVADCISLSRLRIHENRLASAIHRTQVRLDTAKVKAAV